MFDTVGGCLAVCTILSGDEASAFAQTCGLFCFRVPPPIFPQLSAGCEHWKHPRSSRSMECSGTTPCFYIYCSQAPFPCNDCSSPNSHLTRASYAFCFLVIFLLSKTRLYRYTASPSSIASGGAFLFHISTTMRRCLSLGRFRCSLTVLVGLLNHLLWPVSIRTSTLLGLVWIDGESQSGGL